MAHNVIQPTVEADFVITEPFELERGGTLESVTLRYVVYGDLERNRDRVVLVCHALSGSARIGDWWAELFSQNSPFNLEQYCFVGVNILGSCYGSSGPTLVNPATGKTFGPDFPIVTIRDIVRSQAKVLDNIG